MKKRLFYVLTLLLVSIVVAVVGLTVRSMRRDPEELVKLTLDIAPGVAQRIRDFRRVKTRDGKVEWEVAAQEAQVLDESTAVQIKGVELHWYLNDGRVVGLTSDRGTITLDGREVERIDLEGEVVVSLADYEVRVETASYDHQEDTIAAPGPVDVSGKAIRLRGTGLRVDLHKQRLALLRDVSMNLEPARMPRGGAHAPL